MPYKKSKRNVKHWVIGGCILGVTLIAIVAAGLFAWYAYQQDQEQRRLAIEDAKPRIVVPTGYFERTVYHPESVDGIRAVQLTPGVDFYTDMEADEAALSEQIDKVLQQVASYRMNTVIVDTRYSDRVIFSSDQLQSTPVDALRLICEQAGKHGLNVGILFHMSGVARADETLISKHYDPENREILMRAMGEIAVGYELESVSLAGSEIRRGGDSYADYVAYGAVGSYDGWLADTVTASVSSLVTIAHDLKNSLPVGIEVSSVWANAAAQEGGSETNASYQSLTDGHVDSRAMAMNKTVDFINVSIPTSTENTDVPFKTVLSWWDQVCQSSGIGFYVTHAAQNAGNSELQGWNGTTELARQAASVQETAGCYGSIFTGLSKLAENPGGSTDSLIKYYEGAYSQQDLDKDLEVTSPTKWSFQTYEDTVQFRMKFDPEQEVTLNGEKVVPTERGGSLVWVPLEVGKNTIQLAHKGKVYTYQVERLIHIFKDYSPKEAMTVAGGSQIEVNVMAYKGSTITATLNGQTIQLQVGGAGDDNDASSLYVNYQGTFTLPKATAEEQNIGKISIYGKYGPYEDGRSSGAITIDKLPDAVDPDEATGQVLSMVTITDEYAYTYPYLTTPGYPQALLYRLPQGTQDIVESQSGEFLNLRSGKTVKASSGTVTQETFQGNNLISEFSCGVEGGDTVIRATMAWKAPFSITPSPYPSDPKELTTSYQFNANTITITLDYATTMPEAISGSMADSPLFSGISMERVRNEERGIWQYVITLPLRQAGVYLGCHAAYEGNTLVLRFNNPVSSGSLSGVKICVDAGHGGSDTGMIGANVYEKDMNLLQAQKVAEALRQLGAEVIMTRTGDTYLDLYARTAIATQNQVDLFISVHHNAQSGGSTARGIETYYNAPFSKPLAVAVQNQVRQYMTVDRGAKGPEPSYNFVVTRQVQYPSILVEYGFLTNPEDESLAMDENHQWDMANATAQGVLDYFNAMN